MDHSENLLEVARGCQKSAYDPYTGYLVGAAVLDENGRISGGFNIANASSGLGMCAERVAIFSMLLNGGRQLRSLAVVTRNGGSPCGACRQVMREFADDCPVWIAQSDGPASKTSLGALLPLPFAPGTLGKPLGGTTPA